MTTLAYRTVALRDADFDRQHSLLRALDAAKTALHVESGAWRISGSRGHIYSWSDHSDGWLLVLHCRSKRIWTHAKRKLAFCAITQDGDEEGCLKLATLPSPEQALTIRKALGIRKAGPIPSNAFHPGELGLESANNG
jgi:hypothetical protein